MMKVSFPEVDELYLRNKVRNGYYSSVSEAIRDMVRKQRECDRQGLLHALEVGERAIQEGRMTEFTEQLFDEAVQAGVSQASSEDEIVNPDVLPQ